jgi:hypothetical protein
MEQIEINQLRFNAEGNQDNGDSGFYSARITVSMVGMFQANFSNYTVSFSTEDCDRYGNIDASSVDLESKNGKLKGLAYHEMREYFLPELQKAVDKIS